MKLRVARHTNNLQAVIDFYTGLLGLQILGNFAGHDGYDGVFIGLPDMDWHLEFTVSNEAPIHQPDEDDLLVFYPENNATFDSMMEIINKAGITEITAKNTYWQLNGKTFVDPDGYRVVIAIKR